MAASMDIKLRHFVSDDRMNARFVVEPWDCVLELMGETRCGGNQCKLHPAGRTIQWDEFTLVVARTATT
jgi:hypothetical protein